MNKTKGVFKKVYQKWMDFYSQKTIKTLYLKKL